eukprot:gene51670-70406_t
MALTEAGADPDPFIRLAFAAIWAKELDLGDETTVARQLREAGNDPARTIQAAKAERIGEVYKGHIQQAIDAPSFHTEHFPSSFWPRVARPGKVVIEGRFGEAVLEDLKSRGHLAEMGGDWTEGRLSGARIEDDGQMFAGANPRGNQGRAADPPAHREADQGAG